MDAQIPPDLQEYPLKRKRSEMERRLMEWGCLGGFLFVCAAVILPVLNGAREKATDRSCHSNLRQQALALQMYAQDYDERYPPSDRWMDTATPFLKNEIVYRCTEVVKKLPDAYGYAFNRNLSLLKQEKIDYPATTPMIYDANNLARNASASGKKGLASPPRHNERNNMAYADGHVKAVDSSGNE